MIDTVSENRKNYTQKQFEYAKRARKLYRMCGYPTMENFKILVESNQIQNCPVKPEEITIAENIFGPDMGALKGKSTQRKPVPVRDDYIEIPPELKMQHHDITYCMDVMFVNGMPMLTGIDCTIQYQTCVPLENCTVDALYSGMDKVFHLYNKAGFKITSIHCDQEIKPLVLG